MYSAHIETTSRCTLACPRCERTELIDKFTQKRFKVQDININALDEFIDIKLNAINLCGNVGDPIYHADFINLFKMLKTKANRITIITNGSRKNKQWWQELNEIMTAEDRVVFSIDGTPDNFTQYRKNGDWNSVEVGIRACVSGPARTKWKYIPFKFNENNIDEAREISNKLGVDEFFIDPSERWIEDDPLRPEGDYYGPRDKVQQGYRSGIDDFEIDELCKDLSQHYISADGQYSPCCFSKISKFYYKSEWWKNKDQHVITSSKLSEQIEYFNNWFPTIQTNRYNYCVFNCGKCA